MVELSPTGELLETAAYAQHIGEWVSFQSQNLHFPLKNLHFLLKDVDFIIQRTKS